MILNDCINECLKQKIYFHWLKNDTFKYISKKVFQPYLILQANTDVVYLKLNTLLNNVCRSKE